MWGAISYIIIALQGLVYYQLIQYLKTQKFYRPQVKWWVLIPFVLFNLLFVLVKFIWSRDYMPPDWIKYGAVYPLYIWISATMFISLWLLIGKIIKLPFQIPLWIVKMFKPLREKFIR